MARERTKNTSILADTHVLLDVLGNETRRRILDLISHEPMYFNQLAKEIQTGQQAILRHVSYLAHKTIWTNYDCQWLKYHQRFHEGKNDTS